MSARRPAWAPSPRHEHLLRAALGEPEDAEAGWHAWRETVELDDFDPAIESHLLPLVYRNLSSAGVDDPDLGRLKGYYRYWWSRNHLIARSAAGTVDVLRAAGIETLALKGLPVAVLHHGDLGVRPMADADLLVPRERARDAMAALRAAGFSSEFDDPEARIAIQHSAPFADPDEREIDLHWYSLWQSSPDEDFWERAVPVEFGGARSLALCPADELLHICVHGPGWGERPELRWIADAAAVSRGAGDGIDWDRFVGQARKRLLTATVLPPLEYLRDSIALPVPGGALEELRGFAAPRFERVAQRTVSGRSPGGVVSAAMNWDRYRRLALLDPDAPRAPSYPAQLAGWLGHDGIGQLSMHGARWLLKLGFRPRGRDASAANPPTAGYARRADTSEG